VFIEQIMLFALGFLVAGLLTLLFLPAFWRRAMTLARRQLEMQMPLSMTEIVAERDQLRAEFAAEQRRLEQRLEHAEAGRAADKIALGERLIQTVTLEDALKLSRADVAETAAKLLSAAAEASATQAELSTTAKQLYDAESALERRSSALAELSRLHDGLKIHADEQRAAIAGLETRVSSREADIEALERQVAKLRIELADAASEHDAVTHERDQFRTDARNAQSRREALQLEYEAQGRRVEDLQGEIRAVERDKARMIAEAKDSARILEDERKRVRDLNERIAGHNVTLKALQEKSAQEADLARNSRAALEGALEAQRRETDKARTEIASLRDEMRKLKTEAAALSAALEKAEKVAPISPAAAAALATLSGEKAPDAQDFPALRKAIAAIGAEIARVSSERQSEKPSNDERGALDPARTTAAE
jgi:chromosome segregation ATPase